MTCRTRLSLASASIQTLCAKLLWGFQAGFLYLGLYSLNPRAATGNQSVSLPLETEDGGQGAGDPQALDGSLSPVG